MKARGGPAAPRRLVLAGMGLESLDNWDDRMVFFLDAIDRFDTIGPGDPASFVVAFMKTMKIDRTPARLLLQTVTPERIETDAWLRTGFALLVGVLLGLAGLAAWVFSIVWLLRKFSADRVNGALTVTSIEVAK